MVISIKAKAADSTRTITHAQWQRLTDDKAFYYKNQTENVLHAQPSTNNLFLQLLASIVKFLSSPVGHVILWTLFIGLIAYILYYITKGKNLFRFGKKKQHLNKEQSEEDISQTDWERYLRDAVGNGDIRLAVRYSYMLMLHLLQERQFIQYRPDKTNYEYYRELTGTPYGPLFKKLSRSYEYAWYGHLPLPPAAYDDYMHTFNTVKEKLRTS